VTNIDHPVYQIARDDSGTANGFLWIELIFRHQRSSHFSFSISHLPLNHRAGPNRWQMTNGKWKMENGTEQ